MEKNILKCFKECQSSTATHTRLVTKLVNLYLKSDFKKFCNYFVYLMKFNLIHGEKIPVIERTLIFIAKFATSVKTEEKEKEIETNITDEEDVDIDPFLVFIFEFLLQNHDAVSKSVRYRVCQLINQILNFMGEQASIDDHLYTTIYDTMLQRLMDKCHNVRVQAILALSRLQDPRNKECPVIKAYMFHLSMDPNPEVRKAVLSNIAITFQTLPDILDRRRDIRDTVRRQAYIILAQKVHIRSFTIAQRIMIISEGLKDRSSLVQQALKKNVLQAWLRLVDGSILELLKCLDVEASKESAELALKHLFEDVPYDTLLENFNILDARNLIPHEKLSAESALYWICLAKHLKAEKAEEQLEKILPDLKIFCDYVREYVQKESPEDEDPQETAVLMMQKDFVCQQLLSMTIFFDMADEVGRKSLCALVRLLFITPSVSEATIKTLSEVFTYLYPPAARVNELVEIISDIRDPPEAETCPSPQAEPIEEFSSPKETKISEEDERKRKLKLAQISVKMNQIREELEECVRSLNLDKAILLKEGLKKLEEEKTKLLEEGNIITPQATPVVPCSQTRMPEEDDEEVKLRNDPETLTRCLLILCEFLTSSDVTVFGSILRSLHDNLILPCLKSEYDGVRRLAVRGLNLCCLLSKELSKQYLLLLIQMSKMDVEEIQSQALKGVFDIWMLYGLEEFNSAAEDVTEIEDLIQTEGGDNVDDENEGLEDGQTHTVKNMIPLFSKMLETGNKESRTLTAQGLCKMLMVSQVNSTKLLSNLLLLYYNPENEDDNMLRHMLGVFFPLYASLGGTNQESLGKTLIPILHKIFKAPARSPLADIDSDDFINFLVSLTSPSIVSNAAKSTVNAHDTMVFALCAEILGYTDRDYIRTLVRNLNHLSLTSTDYTRLKQIAALTQKIVEKVTDKITLNSAEKFKQTIQNLLASAPKQEEIKNETLDGTLMETVQNSTTDLTTDTLTNVSQQHRRKRILYTTQTDLELISDLDSENDRSPSKIKRLAQHSSVGDTTASSDGNDLTVTNVGETDDEEELKVEEKEVKDFKEIELSMGHEVTNVEETDDEEEDVVLEEKEKENKVVKASKELTFSLNEDATKDSSNLSSSDLFASLEGAMQTPQESLRTPTSIRESEDDDGDISQDTNSRASSSCSSSVNESPPRKSPRMQGVERLRSGRKRETELKKRSCKVTATPSSSSSFYSTRSTSWTPEVPPSTKNKRQKNLQEDTDEDNAQEILNRSLRIRVKKMDINKYKQSTKKSTRKSVDETESKRKPVDETSSSSRRTRSSQSSSVSTEDENLVLRSRLSTLSVNETLTSSTTSSPSAVEDRSRGRNQKFNDGNRLTSKDRKSDSVTRNTRTRSVVTETPSSTSDSLSTGKRTRQGAKTPLSSSDSFRTGTRTRQKGETPSTETRTRQKGETPSTETRTQQKGETPSTETRTRQKGEAPSTETRTRQKGETPSTETRTRQKAISKVLESGQSRTTRSSISSLRGSDSTTSSPVTSSPASIASIRGRRMKTSK